MSQGREKATWINGIEMSGPSLQIYAEGAEMLYRAGRDTEWMAISISRRSLQDAAIEILGAELPLPASGMINHVISASMARRLLELVRSQPTFSQGLPGYENLILIALVTAIASANHEKPHHSTARAIRRLEIVSRADRAIRDLVGSRYSSEALCRAVGASERSIQTHFQEAFGMSPKSCFTTLALNQARTVLMNTDFRPGIISETALKFGFEHLGRFRELSRSLF
ncbi:MAG: AraC family transcriptional regulator [Verrucomicrobiales bacterium]|nr:AraC family transcriptional regulator [Verrucomicrobiales bacterium]